MSSRRNLLVCLAGWFFATAAHSQAGQATLANAGILYSIWTVENFPKHEAKPTASFAVCGPAAHVER